MTTIVIPQKIKKEMKRVSNTFGISTNDLMLNSIAYYLKRVKDRVDFKLEMDAWERAGIEDWTKFEKSI